MSYTFWDWRPFHNRSYDTPFAIAEPVGKRNIGDNRDRAMCPVCGNGMGMLPWLPPHRIWLTKSNYPDFLYSGSSLFVSGRFKELYEGAGLTGITRFDPPAEIARVAGRPVEDIKKQPPQYHYIWHVYDGGELDDEHSGAIRPEGLCVKCRQGMDRFDRVVLKEDSWTGVDVFQAYGLPGTTLVSERFLKLVDKHNLTGSTLVPAEKYHWDSRKPLPRF